MKRKLTRPSKFNPYSMPGVLFAADDGGGGGGPVGDPPADAPKDAPKEKASEKTLTQTEVNVIAAREKAEGKRAAEAAIAESLGVSIEDAKAILTKHRESEEAKKTDVDKAKDAADKEKSSATAEKSAAAQEIHETRLERAFLKEGLDSTDEKASRVLRMVTVKPGASYEDVLKDVQAVKADFPALFDEQEVSKRKSPSGDPKGKPPKATGGEDAFARGAERAKGHRGAYMAQLENVKK